MRPRQAGSLGAAAGGEPRGDGQAHRVFDRDLERLDVVARQIKGVAAEGITHGKIDGHPVPSAVHFERLGHVFTSDETYRMHAAEASEDDSLQIALFAAARG